MEKVLKNMGGLYIGHLYWIIQRNTGTYAVCTEGSRKSVQLQNIGSMCVTALPYSNLPDDSPPPRSTFTCFYGTFWNTV